MDTQVRRTFPPIFSLLIPVLVIGFGLWFFAFSNGGKKVAGAAMNAAKPQFASSPTAQPTDTPTPTPNYLMETEQVGRAQAAVLDAQNKALAGTISADSATLDAGIKMTAASDSRTAVAQQQTAAANITATEIAVTQGVMMARAQTVHEQQKVEQDVAFGKSLLYDIFFPLFIVGMITILLFAGAVRLWQLFERVLERETSKEIEDNEPENELPTMVEVHSGGNIRRHGELPCTDEQIEIVAAGVTGGKGLSDTAWIGQGFTRGEWYTLRQWLIDNGFAQWRNEKNHTAGGSILTKVGWEFMRYVVAETPSPTTESQ